MNDRMRRIEPWTEDWARFERSKHETDVMRRQALVDRFWSHHAQWTSNTTAEQRVLNQEHETATRASVLETASRWLLSWWHALLRWIRG